MSVATDAENGVALGNDRASHRHRASGSGPIPAELLKIAKNAADTANMLIPGPELLCPQPRLKTLTLKELAADMRLHPRTVGRLMKRLKHKPSVNNQRGYRFTEENAEQLLSKWQRCRFKANCPHKRKRKRR